MLNRARKIVIAASAALALLASAPAVQQLPVVPGDGEADATVLQWYWSPWTGEFCLQACIGGFCCKVVVVEPVK